MARRTAKPAESRPEAVEGYTFDQARADRVVRFIETFCIHSKGRWAGQPYELMDWQKKEIIEPLFGWVGPDGTRRYRSGAIFTPKKNGKSTMMSALGLYFLIADKELGSEVYIAAADRLQAGIIYRECSALVKANPLLSSRLEVVDSRNTIVDRATMSRLAVLSSDSHRAEGLNAHAVLIDELHSQRDRRLFDALRWAGASRKQPFFCSISTAGYDRSPGAIWFEQWKYAERIQADPASDPSFFGRIYAAKEQDDPKAYFEDKSLWYEANPSLGVTITEESFAADAKEAENNPAKLNAWLRYRLNIPTNADVAWFSVDQWADGNAPLPDLTGRPCYVGLDLASNRDITAMVALFPLDDGTFAADCRFWVPETQVREREYRDNIPYSQWAREGWITTTEGDICDYEKVYADIVEYGERHEIKQIAADRWGAAATITKLQGAGFDVVGFNQSFGAFTAAVGQLEALVLGKRLTHAGNPVLAWMAQNVHLDEDANGNRRPSKKKSTEKIDGIVSLCMAAGIHATAKIQAEQNWEIYEL